MSKLVVSIGVIMTMLLLGLARPVAAQQENLLNIETLHVVEEEGRLILEISGTFNNGCERIGEVTQALEGDTITITITVTRPGPFVACTQAIESFVERIPLDIGELEAGDYTLVVNGISTAMTLEEGGVVTDGEATVICPTAPDDALTAYVNESGEYCFLYPAEYEVVTQTPNSLFITALRAPDAGVPPSLTITYEPANDRTLDDVVRELEASFAEFELTVTERLIAGQPAVIVEGLPGRFSNRQAFVLVDETLYILVVLPLDPALPEVTAAAETLWAVVLESLTFQHSELTAQSVGEGAINVPLNWQIEVSADETVVAVDDISSPLLSLVPAPEGNDADIMAFYEAQGEENLQVERLSLGEEEITVIYGVDDYCAVVVLPLEAQALLAQIYTDYCVDDFVLNPVVVDVLEYLLNTNE